MMRIKYRKSIEPLHELPVSLSNMEKLLKLCFQLFWIQNWGDGCPAWLVMGVEAETILGFLEVEMLCLEFGKNGW